MKPAEAKKFLKDNNIKFILAQFVDIHGAAKAKAVPASHLDDVLTTGAGFAGFALWGFGMGPHGPDYMAVGEIDTLQPIPWMPGYARICTIGHVNGKPYPFDSRLALRNAAERLKKKGYTLYTGVEPEFMLLKRNDDGSLAPYDDTDTLDKPCYDYKGLARSRAYIEKLVESVQQVGLDVYQVDHEDANGQFEVNFTYADCQTTADRVVTFKMAASEIAKEMGMIATFMPKPFSNRTGTGAHYHISMGDGKTKNVFHDDGDKRKLGLSKIGYQFMAGIMHHAPALCAIAAPSINSYKRLVVGRSLSGATWAPAYVCYGDNNRTSTVRVPYGRLEFRLPDGSSNPYLVTAALIAAGMDGIERKLDPGEPINENLYEFSLEKIRSRGITILPQSLGQALDALEADKTICDGIGMELAKEFINVKRMEWVEYSRHVSKWETDRYLEMF